LGVNFVQPASPAGILKDSLVGGGKKISVPRNRVNSVEAYCRGLAIAQAVSHSMRRRVLLGSFHQFATKRVHEVHTADLSATSSSVSRLGPIPG
jgi:hypothetical protein